LATLFAGIVIKDMLTGNSRINAFFTEIFRTVKRTNVPEKKVIEAEYTVIEDKEKNRIILKK